MYLDVFCEYLHGYKQFGVAGSHIICDHFAFFKSVNITPFLSL